MAVTAGNSRNLKESRLVNRLWKSDRPPSNPCQYKYKKGDLMEWNRTFHKRA
jgi:hypothetical protein